MMFGIGTRRARLHVDAFVNMLGFFNFFFIFFIKKTHARRGGELVGSQPQGVALARRQTQDLHQAF